MQLWISGVPHYRAPDCELRVRQQALTAELVVSGCERLTSGSGDRDGG